MQLITNRTKFSIDIGDVLLLISCEVPNKVFAFISNFEFIFKTKPFDRIKNNQYIKRYIGKITDEEIERDFRNFSSKIEELVPAICIDKIREDVYLILCFGEKQLFVHLLSNPSSIRSFYITGLKL